VGTREEDGGHDLAPKHLAMPLSWRNCVRVRLHAPGIAPTRMPSDTGRVTVSYPRPGQQVVVTSLAAAPRCGEHQDKPALPGAAGVSSARPWMACWSKVATSIWNAGWTAPWTNWMAQPAGWTRRGGSRPSSALRSEDRRTRQRIDPPTIRCLPICIRVGWR